MTMSLFDLCDDILELIEVELRPRLKYNQVVREFKDPRFHKAANRVFKQISDREVHPGRQYVRVIYPTLRGFSYWCIDRFKCEDINLHGMLIRTSTRHYWNNADVTSKQSVRDYTHSDIDAILTSFGVKRFKSLNKNKKLSMVMKMQ